MRSSPDVGRGCTPRRFGRMVPLRGEFGMAGHIITVTPHIRDGQKHPNAFDAYLGDRFVCTSETFSSARIPAYQALVSNRPTTDALGSPRAR